MTNKNYFIVDLYQGTQREAEIFPHIPTWLLAVLH